MSKPEISRIRVAIQKSGRLSERSLDLLRNCGLQFARSKDKLFWYGKDFPVDLLLVRDDDIPRLLLDGVCDLGIVGENIAGEVMLERNGGEGLRRLAQTGLRAMPPVHRGAGRHGHQRQHGIGRKTNRHLVSGTDTLPAGQEGRQHRDRRVVRFG